jgi:hypothetical protein
MKTVIIGGVIANKYNNGGAVWTRLNWILGLRKLGFDVYFVEQIEQAKCIDENALQCDFESSANLGYFRRIMQEFGLARSSALVCDNGEQSHGMSMGELNGLVRDTDLVLNITGHLHLPSVMESNACKIYVDLDPGYTQYWYQMGVLDSQFVKHDQYFTIGEAIGTPTCSIPTSGIPWQATRQPVVLEHWPVSRAGEPNRFTTVASWRDTYGTLKHDGQKLGLKVHEFRKFIELPQRISQVCELALDIHPADHHDLDLLRKNGWVIRDPLSVAPDPAGFRDYIQGSGAEFSVAKGIYSQTNSGWFSDRTVRYLASGKPALVQDTGFSQTYPVGEGLLSFQTMEEAVTGAHAIETDYDAHCHAARQLAEFWFDSDRVLGKMMDQVGISP